MRTFLKIILLMIIGIFFSSYICYDCIVYDNELINHSHIKKFEEKTADGWIGIYFYNQNGLLYRRVNYFRESKRSEYQYCYDAQDSILIITKNSILDSAASCIDNIFCKQNKCHSVYRQYGNKNISYNLAKDFLYNGNLIKSYKTEYPNVKFVFHYNEKQQIVKRTEIFNDIDTTELINYFYNNTGQMIDMIQSSPKSDVVYSDVITWSKKTTNKTHIRYSHFDKHGNWTRRYYITSKGKILRSKRKIEYYE